MRPNFSRMGDQVREVSLCVLPYWNIQDELSMLRQSNCNTLIYVEGNAIENDGIMGNREIGFTRISRNPSEDAL